MMLLEDVDQKLPAILVALEIRLEQSTKDGLDPDRPAARRRHERIISQVSLFAGLPNHPLENLVGEPELRSEVIVDRAEADPGVAHDIPHRSFIDPVLG